MLKENRPIKPPQPRKPYQKPQVQMVKLVAEEAVLAMCKGDYWAGPGDTDCRPVGPCVTIGS